MNKKLKMFVRECKHNVKELRYLHVGLIGLNTIGGMIEGQTLPEAFGTAVVAQGAAIGIVSAGCVTFYPEYQFDRSPV